MFRLLQSYENVWKALIMPTRVDYTIDQLGPVQFMLQGSRIKRNDFRLCNKRGMAIECSYFEHMNPKIIPTPCIIYLHGSGCCRLEAIQYMEIVLTNQINLFCFDFTASGKSDGKYSSLGIYEQDDLAAVIKYLLSLDNVGKIGIWGRSMGAVTALMYCGKDNNNIINNKISCLVSDSAFADFKILVKEFIKKKGSFAGLFASGAFALLRSTIKKRAGFSIGDLMPIKMVGNLKIPALFGHSIDDLLIPIHHAKDLCNKCKAPKKMVVFDGDHNSVRPINFQTAVIGFFKKYLLANEQNDLEIEVVTNHPDISSIIRMNNGLNVTSANQASRLEKVSLMNQSATNYGGSFGIGPSINDSDGLDSGIERSRAITHGAFSKSGDEISNKSPGSGKSSSYRGLNHHHQNQQQQQQLSQPEIISIVHAVYGVEDNFGEKFQPGIPISNFDSSTRPKANTISIMANTSSGGNGDKIVIPTQEVYNGLITNQNAIEPNINTHM